MKFKTTIKQSGKNTTGIEIPAEIVAKLGTSKRPAVKATINGYTYRSSIASMGGKFMLSVSADVRGKTGVKGGDKIELGLELDTEKREVNVPEDLKKALNKDAKAKKFFEGLSYSNKLRHVLSIEGAKTPETRQRRIEKSVGMFHEERAI